VTSEFGTSEPVGFPGGERASTSEPVGFPGGERASTGHRTVPHTADLRIEAWAPTRDECIAEALRGLVGSFADLAGVAGARSTERRVTARTDADLLAAAADELIYLLDAEGEIPVTIQVRPPEPEQASAPGGPAGSPGGERASTILVLALAPVEAAQVTGAIPKAVTLHELACAPAGPGSWRASMTVDV